jgi:RNase P subunit RPR2
MTTAMRIIPIGDQATLADYRFYAGARVLITCSLCGWSKSYNAERIIDRLRTLKTGGHKTTLGQVARRVAWPCPGCGRVKWRAQFAYPPGFSEADHRRATNRYRN